MSSFRKFVHILSLRHVYGTLSDLRIDWYKDTQLQGRAAHDSPSGHGSWTYPKDSLESSEEYSNPWS